jgi:serine/threonine protein kinase
MPSIAQLERQICDDLPRFERSAHADMNREFAALSRLNHPNIIRFGEIVGEHCGLVTESGGGPLQSSARRAAIMLQRLLGVAAALFHAHERHVVYNALDDTTVRVIDATVNRLGTAKLIDFSSSVIFDGSVPSSVDTFAGSQSLYTAPENYVSCKTDVFAFGVLGRQMFFSTDPIFAPPPLPPGAPLPPHNSQASDAPLLRLMSVLFNWCTKEQPCDRPTMAEIRDILSNIGAHTAETLLNRVTSQAVANRSPNSEVPLPWERDGYGHSDWLYVGSMFDACDALVQSRTSGTLLQAIALPTSVSPREQLYGDWPKGPNESTRLFGSSGVLVRSGVIGFRTMDKYFYQHVRNSVHNRDSRIGVQQLNPMRLLHPNVVEVVHLLVDADEGRVVGVTMVYAGQPLTDVVHALTPTDIIAIALQVQEPLAFAESHNIAHGALQPKNILVQRSLDGQFIAKITNFPYARMYPVTTGNSETRALFADPELHDSMAAATSSDVFAFGMLLWWLASHGVADHGLGSTAHQIRASLSNGRRPSLEAVSESWLLQTIVGCWEPIALNRWTWARVGVALRRAQASTVVQAALRQTVTLCIKGTNRGGFEVQVNMTDTVALVKQQLGERLGRKKDKMLLTYSGKTMQDDKMILDYCAQATMAIFLHIA